MPQSPLPDIHTPTSRSSSTMSLAILPSSPMPYSQASMPALLPPAPSPAKRPKLTLNTSTTPQVFGKGSTSLRLETLSATSPTGRNTFRNGYGQDRSLKTTRAKPQRPNLTPLATVESAPAKPQLPTPLRTDLPSSAESGDITSSSAASTTSISTIDSLSTEVPYKLTYNITSILSNGPLPRTKSKKTSFAPSRPMFPLPKRVAFRAPLTEDIKTSKYTMAHSDIDSSNSTISTLELPSPAQELKHDKTKEVHAEDAKDGAAEDTLVASPRTGEKRESSDEDDSDTCPATPVAGRRKKSRQWRWTLGPVEPESEVSSQSPQSQDKRHKNAEVMGVQTEGS